MKHKILLSLGLLACSPNFFVSNVHANDFMEETDDDFFDFDNDEDIHIDDNLKEQTRSFSSSTPTRSITGNFAAWRVAFSHADVKPVLYTNIYLKSHSIPTRSIQTYPLGLHYLYKQETSCLSASFFLNRTSKKNFTSSNTTLDSYIDLKNGELPDILDKAARAGGGAGTMFNIGESLGLAAPAKVQEHRFGVLLQADRYYKNWHIDMQLPFLYSERNLFFTDREKDALYDSALVGLIGSSDNISEWEIAKRHFILDKIGFGDFSLKATTEIFINSDGCLELGGFATLPTNFAIKKGIIGTHFTPTNNHPALGLCDINPNAAQLTDANKAQLKNFFSAAMDHLSANILQAELGNKRHITFGALGNFDWYINDAWTMNSNYEFGISLPSTEQRFYIQSITKDEFETKFAAAKALGTAAEKNQAVTELAEEQITNRLFPLVYDTKVFPGFNINGTTHFARTFKNYNFNFGWNWWYQSKEKLYNISAPASKLATIDIENATTPSTSQFKLFGKVHHNYESKNHIWSLSLYTDVTLWNSGIGNDFTLGASLDYKF